jgi:hypothetical protein
MMGSQAIFINNLYILRVQPFFQNFINDVNKANDV